MGLTNKDRVALRDYLVSHFSLAEMQELVFELGIPYDSLPHETQGVLAVALIQFCERRSTLGCLLERIICVRPHPALGAFLDKVQACQDKPKVHIVLPAEVELNVPPEHLRHMLSHACKGISPDQVILIGSSDTLLRQVPAEINKHKPSKGPQPNQPLQSEETLLVIVHRCGDPRQDVARLEAVHKTLLEFKGEQRFAITLRSPGKKDVTVDLPNDRTRDCPELRMKLLALGAQTSE